MDEADEATRVVPPAPHDRARPAMPNARTSKYVAVFRHLEDAMLTSTLAVVLAAVAEAVQLQVAGLGAQSTVEALRFVAASGLLVVPLGAMTGVAIYLVFRLIPTGRLAALRDRLTTPWMYAVGLVLPLVLACSFRLFLVVSASFQNEALAALASALLSAAIFAGAVVVSFLVVAAAQAAGRRKPALLRRSVAIACVLAVWAVIALPGIWAGPGEALRSSSASPRPCSWRACRARSRPSSVGPSRCARRLEPFGRAATPSGRSYSSTGC